MKLPCHLLLGKLAATAGEHLLPELPAVIGPLDKTLSVQIKQDAVKQEVSNSFRGSAIAKLAHKHPNDESTCCPGVQCGWLKA